MRISTNRKYKYSLAVLFLTMLFLSVFDNSYEISNTYYVAPNGKDTNDGLSPSKPLQHIQKALELAEPGDTIILADGVYREDIKTVRDGEVNAPITIKGSHNAIVKAKKSSKVIEINHDYIILDGFTIDGHKSGDIYTDKLVWLMHASHVKIINMIIKNAAEECIRLKYFSSNNEIAYNQIKNCGTKDFKYKNGGKNGEHIYIGTAPEQLYKNPTSEPDASNNNWIHNNIFSIGSECVDIKEGSSYNIIEYNTCKDMKDADSGGISIRGNENIVRYNKIYNNDGAGIRLGGDKENDGINNDIYSNEITNNLYSIKFMAHPQGLVCGNVIDKEPAGKFKDSYKPTQAC